ncbi:PAS domain S-box protein [Methanomicrobium sp. W14]|uniref:PAS domain S-box protein n=1 Tax=Methanomicrobium sp. W14 TaxID=2817839 RepID=UPI0032AEBB1F
MEDKLSGKNRFLKNYMKKKLGSFWSYVLLGILVFIIFICEISLYLFSDGMMMFISHMFYFPLFLLIYRYPKKGIEISVFLGMVYYAIVVFLSYPAYYDLVEGLLFLAAYIGIGTGASVLAESLRDGENKLVEIKNNYENLFENTNDSVFVHNLEGRILLCNRHAKEMFDKCMCKENMTLADLDDSLGTDAFETSCRSLSGQDHVELEAVIKSKQGVTRHIEINSSITDRAEGYVHVFVRDITERKKFQIALEESESRLRVLTNQIPEMIFELDREGCIRFATRYSLNMFGYEPDELTGGMKLWDILSDSDRERSEKNFSWFMTGHIVGATEYLGRKKDGTSFPVMMNMSYIFSDSKVSEIEGLRGIAIDISQRKQMESALKNSEKRYRNLFESSNDAILLHYINGRIIDFNERLAFMLGYERDAVIGFSVYDLFSKPAHDYVSGAFLDLEKKKSLFFETEMKKKDGTVVIVEVSSSYVPNSSGIVQSVLRDITERKKSREALVESEKRFRNLTDLLPQVVFEIDSDGILTFANKNAFESFSVSGKDFSGGLKFCDVIAVCDRRRAEDNFRSLLLGESSGNAREYIAERKDGSEFPMLVYASPIEKGGRIVGARGIGIDITERKKMEEALRVSEERLNLAIHNSGVCVWDWDMEKDRIYFAGNYPEMFGYEGDCQRSQTEWREILQVQFFSDVMDFFVNPDGECSESSPKKEHFESEYHINCKNGTCKWINVIGKIAGSGSSGMPGRIVGIMQDITQIKQYQNALYEANRKLNLLSSITRHDILNQIAGINGFTDLMYRKVAGDSELTHHLDRIKQASGNIKDQITFTRDYHNVGVESPQWQRVDVIAGNMKSKAKTMGIHLDMELPPLEVYADPMLEKIFFNLLDNAARHGEKVTKMVISFSQSEANGIIVVKDNGTGVQEKLKKRIFDHGFGSNTGLGLFLAEKILSITGLKIVENGVFGEGARFEIIMTPENYRISKENSK